MIYFCVLYGLMCPKEPDCKVICYPKQVIEETKDGCICGSGR